MDNLPNQGSGEPLKSGIVIKLTILTITALLGFALLEFLIFKVAPQKTMYYDRINTKPTLDLYQYGDKRPVEVRPNLRLYNITDLYKEYSFDIITDEFGFRREGTDPLKPSVIILGDSMTFGYTVSNNEAYPNILDESYQDCQIINAGKPGAGLNHYVYYLREMLRDNNLKDVKQIIVGLNIPGNDWYEMPSLPQKIDPELAQFSSTHERYTKAKNSLMNKIKTLLLYSQTYTFLRQTVAPRIKHVVLGLKDTSATEEKEYSEIGPPVEELIKTMVSTAKENSIGISFVFLPERPHYFSKIPLYVTKLQKFMDEKGIRYFDLLPPMRDMYQKTSDFWQPIEGHYNASGHKFIASEIENADVIECGKND